MGTPTAGQLDEEAEVVEDQLEQCFHFATATSTITKNQNHYAITDWRYDDISVRSMYRTKPPLKIGLCDLAVGVLWVLQNHALYCYAAPDTV